MNMEFYTIGQISKMCNIPIKTLRYYDEIDLLKPDKICDENKYRYYSNEKILQVPVIRYYKSLGFKSKDIKKMLDRVDNNILGEYFAKELIIIEKQIEDLRKKHLAIVEWYELLKQGEFLISSSNEEIKVEIKTIPIYRTVHLSYEIKDKQEGLEIIDNSSFVEFCNENGVFAYGPFMLYFESYNNRMNNTFDKLHFYSSIIEDKKTTAIIETIGNFNAITAIHKGNYKNINDTYILMLNWAKRNNIKLKGTSFERYIIDSWSTVGSENYVTEIILPINS